jgi:hypothetical protein
MKSITYKKCVICETAFSPYHKLCKTCSVACREQLNRDKAKAFRALHIDYIRRYEKDNRHKINIRRKERAKRIRLLTLSEYGGKCACCGEAWAEALQIDHINGDGSKLRRNGEHNGGFQFYMDLKKRGWPKDNYQILCANCNVSKRSENMCKCKSLGRKGWGGQCVNN